MFLRLVCKFKSEIDTYSNSILSVCLTFNWIDASLNRLNFEIFKIFDLVVRTNDFLLGTVYAGQDNYFRGQKYPYCQYDVILSISCYYDVTYMVGDLRCFVSEIPMH